MNIFVVVSQIISWGCVAILWQRIWKQPELTWTARWQTLFTLASTLAFIASPGSFAFYIAIGVFAVALVATYVSLARLVHWWPRRRGRRAATRHVEETVARVIADGTAYPPRDATEDAKKSLLEGVVNAIGFLKQCHTGEDYALPGPHGSNHQWHWQRSDESCDRQENCIALAQVTYTMLYMAAADILGCKLRVGNIFCIDAVSINALVAYIAYQRDVADLLVAPLPYSQQEYREALEPTTQAMVLEKLSDV